MKNTFDLVFNHKFLLVQNQIQILLLFNTFVQFLELIPTFNFMGKVFLKNQFLLECKFTLLFFQKFLTIKFLQLFFFMPNFNLKLEIDSLLFSISLSFIQFILNLLQSLFMVYLCNCPVGLELLQLYFIF